MGLMGAGFQTGCSCSGSGSSAQMLPWGRGHCVPRWPQAGNRLTLCNSGKSGHKDYTISVFAIKTHDNYIYLKYLISNFRIPSRQAYLIMGRLSYHLAILNKSFPKGLREGTVRKASSVWGLGHL